MMRGLCLVWDFEKRLKLQKCRRTSLIQPARSCWIYVLSGFQAWRMRLPERWPTIRLYQQGTCTHTTLQRSSLPPISNGLLRNPMITSQDSVNHGNPTQKPVCIPYVQLRNAESIISSHDAAMLAHVPCVVNEAGVIFQIQVRPFWYIKLLDSSIW